MNGFVGSLVIIAIALLTKSVTIAGFLFCMLAATILVGAGCKPPTY